MKTLRSVLVVFFIVLTYSCSTKPHLTKTVPPVPKTISTIKVMDVEGCCRTDYIFSILMVELSKPGRIQVDDTSTYGLKVKVDGYHPSYRRYIALSARIIDLRTDKAVWYSSISGISARQFIDDLIKGTIVELVKEMNQSM